jgi:hypothetical protein
MRPKVVIFTLVLAFGLLGAIALLKGVAQKPSQPAGGTGESAGTGQNATPAANSVSNGTAGANTGAPVAVSDEVRQALIDKELEQIRTLKDQIDGTNNAMIFAALLQKMSSPEAEVRGGVLQAFRELNDTNAVPGLLKAADGIKDAREKVAVLDLVDYLKAPDILAGVNPDDYTNKLAIRTNTNKPKLRPGLRLGGASQRGGNNGPAPAQPVPDGSPAPAPQ